MDLIRYPDGALVIWRNGAIFGRWPLGKYNECLSVFTELLEAEAAVLLLPVCNPNYLN